MIKKILFLFTIALAGSSLVQGQTIFDRIWPFGKKTEKHNCIHHPVKVNHCIHVPAQIPVKVDPYPYKADSRTYIPVPAKANPSNVIIALICLLCMLPIGIAFGYSFPRFSRRKKSLPLASIESFFMPHEGQECKASLYQDLLHSKKRICIASYWVTHLNIIMALRMARKRNVLVEIIFDKSTPNATTLQQQFRNCGVKFTESDIDAARMHHKFIIIDDIITWVGSANLTGTAFSKNYENMMRIRSTEIAQRYLIDFKNLMRELGKSRQSSSTQKASSSANPNRSSAFHNRPAKPISDYQKRVLEDFGLGWQGLNYDEAYETIDRVIYSVGRLHARAKQ